MRIKNWLKTLLVSLFFIASCAGAATSIDKIIVFGDSLSDNGNVYNLLAGAKKVIPLVPLIPKSPPYFDGHFTNGIVWVEHLSKMLNVPLLNYAYGGSWAEGFLDSLQLLPPSLGTQVDMYLINPSTIVDYNMHKHLYVIWSGSNDYLLADRGEASVTKTVNSIASNIDWLVRMGARKILVLNLPGLGRSPHAVLRGQEFVERLDKLVTMHNDRLAKKIQSLQKDYPAVTFIYADVTDEFEDIIINPHKYNLKNVSEPCYKGGYMFRARMEASKENPELKAAEDAKFQIADNSVLMDAYLNSVAASKGFPACSNPEEYLFWDRLHPTGMVHQLIGLGVFTRLAELGVLTK